MTKTAHRILRLNTILLFLILTGLVPIQSALAHHSAAMFDLETVLELKGTVAKFQFTNPHVWIHLTVTDENNQSKLWKIEALNPNALKRKGWKRTSFKPGDEVTITIHPAKSGNPKGAFIRGVTADGTELGQKLADRER